MSIIKKKAKRLIKPYIITCVIWAIPVAFLVRKMSVKTVFHKYILGEDPDQLWFLLMLFWVFVFSVVIFRFVDFDNLKIIYKILLLGICVGGYLCTVGLRVIEMPDLFGVQAALEYELFFVGGMVYASLENDWITVYGPAGRPDMAYFGFTNKLCEGSKIQIFNYGNCKRDFTYVDDIVEGVKRVMQSAPEKKIGEDGLPVPPYAVYNIGNNRPENLLDFVDILQQELIRAEVLPEDYRFDDHKELVAMQPGDVPITYADTTALERDFGFKPSTSLREGLRKFAEWYKKFYIK